MNDLNLFERVKKELFTAVVGDVLDTLGYRHQFLPQPVTPLVPGTVLIGRAMPVLEADYLESDGPGPLSRKPFGLMFEALDSLKENEIYVTSGASFDYALWGGLMSTRAQHLKAAGAVVNGFIRDTSEIRRLAFPVFSRGSYAQDQGGRGKVVDYNVPISFGGIVIRPGDLLFGDEEGVVVVPREAEAEAFARAFEKVATENEVANAIRHGMSTVDAFDQFGVM